ncbi:MAG: Response regulator protein TmoT [Pseudomonadota bacterium]
MNSVYVIDDNADVLQQVALVLERAGHQVFRYLNPVEFLKNVRPGGPAAIVLDVRMPGMSGLELQAALKAKSVRTPIVFISGESQPKEIIMALKAQAVDFLLKPFSAEDLRAAVAVAIDHDQRRLKQEELVRSIQLKRELLSARERDAFHLIIRGYSNKELAAELDVKPDTAKKYRAAILAKFEVGSLAELLAFVQASA